MGGGQREERISVSSLFSARTFYGISNILQNMTESNLGVRRGEEEKERRRRERKIWHARRAKEEKKGHERLEKR